jgi:hypothetical protein
METTLHWFVEGVDHAGMFCFTPDCWCFSHVLNEASAPLMFQLKGYLESELTGLVPIMPSYHYACPTWVWCLPQVQLSPDDLVKLEELVPADKVGVRRCDRPSL